MVLGEGSLRSRRSGSRAIVLVLAILATACSHSSAVNSRHGGSVALNEAATSPVEDVPSALQDPAAIGLPKPLVNPALIQPGGPPPDGIPPLDHPRFQRADQVDWLRPREPVLAASVNGEDRAY